MHGRTLLGAANADTGCLAPCVIYTDAWTPNFSNRRNLHGRTLLGAANADAGCLAPCIIYADAWTPNFSSQCVRHACPQKLSQRRRARAQSRIFVKKRVKFSGSTHWMSGRQTFLVKCSGSKLSEAIPRAAVHAKLFQRIGTQASAESCSDSSHEHARGCTKSTPRQSATTHNCSQTAMLREYFWEVAETPNFRLPQAMSARARTPMRPAAPHALAPYIDGDSTFPGGSVEELCS